MDAVSAASTFLLFNIVKFVDFFEMLTHNGIIIYAIMTEEWTQEEYYV